MALTYLWHELWTRRRSTLQTAGTVAAFIGLIVLVQGLSGAFLRALEAPFRTTGAHLTVQRAGAPPKQFEGAVLPNTHGPFSPSDIKAVRSQPEVRAVQSAIYFWWMEGSSFTPVLGLERLGDREIEPGTAVVAAGTAAQRGIQPGGTVRLGGQTLKVTGLFEEGAVPVGGVPYVISSNDARAWVSESGAQDWPQEGANLLLVEAHPSRTGPLLISIPPLLGDNRPRDTDGDVDENAVQQRGERQVTLTSTETLRQSAGGLFGLMSRFAFLITAIVGVTGLLLLLKTFAAALAERRREAGILKAIGWTTRNLISRYVAESAVVGLIGGAAGTAVAGLLLRLLSGVRVALPAPGTGGSAQPGISAGASQPLAMALEAHLPVALVVSAMAGAILAGVLTSLVFAGRIRNIKPAEVLQYE